MNLKFEITSELAEKFIEHSTDGFLVLDRDYRYIYWSNIMENISGLRAREVIGRNAFEIFPFLKQTGIDQLFTETITETPTKSINIPFNRPESNKSGFFEGRYFPLKKDGAIIGIAGIIRDITEQKLTAEILKETETRFQNMADSSPVLLWTTGTDTLCNFFNQTWLDFTGKTLEQELGVGWIKGIHPEDSQKCVETYIAKFNERHSFEMEYRLKRFDGEYRWILGRGVPRYSPQGIFAGFIVSCVDITEIKKLELELKQAVRNRDEFLAIASHELKTPLSSLRLQLGMLSHLFQGKFDIQQIIQRAGKVTETARRQLSRLTELIEDLLSVSRISAGQFVLDRTHIDLVSLTKEISERLNEVAIAAQCTIEIKAGEPIYGLWDSGKLDQVLTNLLTNALRYAPGKPIEISIIKTTDRAILRVRDHGMGISKAKQIKIFDKFQRGVSSRNYSGLGLGLYITRTIVEYHEGQIWVESREGEGATFIIELPIFL